MFLKINGKKSFLNKLLFSCDWVHPSEAREKAKAAARYDFHQTTDTIYCNVYCKGNDYTIIIQIYIR